MNRSVALGVRQVVLTGGEPLMHRDLVSLCSFFRDLNIRLTLLTTGLLLLKRAETVAILYLTKSSFRSTARKQFTIKYDVFPERSGLSKAALPPCDGMLRSCGFLPDHCAEGEPPRPALHRSSRKTACS